MAESWETPKPYAAGYATGPGNDSGGWGAPPMPPTPEMAAAYALRPLSTGEVLDRTFTVYRSHFWLFAGIACFSGAVQVVVNAFNLLGHHLILNRRGMQTASIADSAGSIVGAALFLLASSITQAATVYALSAVYLGQQAQVIDSFRAVLGRWYRWIGIGLWQGWSIVWLPMLLGIPATVLFFMGTRRSNMTMEGLGGFLLFVAVFGGMVFGVIAFIRNSLAVQAGIIEGLKVRPSMRRSKVLAAGTKGRIFVVLLIAASLGMVFGAIQAPLAFLILRTPLEEHIAAQTVMLLIAFASHTLVSPVALIGLTLVYFDQRVRKEAFDILMLMGPEPVAVPTTPIHVQTIAADTVVVEQATIEAARMAGMPSEEMTPQRASDENLP